MVKSKKQLLWDNYIKSGLTLEKWKERQADPKAFDEANRKKKGKKFVAAQNKVKKIKRAEYVNYIASEEWKKKRIEAFKYYGKKCDMCGTSVNLHVHHKTYDRFKKEIMSDLQILCSVHHMELHRNLRKEKKDK